MSVRTMIAVSYAALAFSASCGNEDARIARPDPEPAQKPRFIRIDPEIARRLIPPGGRPATVADPIPEIGKTYVVAIGDRVVMVNRYPVGDRVRWFQPGEDCRVDPGGTMLIIATRDAGDELGHWTEYLVRYGRPPKTSEYYVDPERDAEPYACPDRARFYHDDPLFIAEDPQ